MRIHGTISRVFLPRGFAFIVGDDGNEYFLQANQFEGSWEGRRVHEGARVEFAPMSDGVRGNKLRAMQARTMS